MSLKLTLHKIRHHLQISLAVDIPPPNAALRDAGDYDDR
jgi:hypothetical protein